MPLKEIATLKDTSCLSLFLKLHLPVVGDGYELFINVFTTPKYSQIYLGGIINLTDDFSLEKDREGAALVTHLIQFNDSVVNLNADSIEYFFKILDIAKENNISIIFIKYPLSKEYDMQLQSHNISREDYYDNLFSQINKTTRDYFVLDYYNLFFEHPEYLSNADHLNARGNDILSKKISEDLMRISMTKKYASFIK